MTDLTYKVIRKFTFVLLDKGDRKLSFLIAYRKISYLFKTIPAVQLSSEYRLLKMTWNKRMINQNNKITGTNFLNLIS